MKRILTLLLSIIIVTAGLKSQIQTKVISPDEFLQHVKYHGFDEAEVYDLPSLDIRALINEDDAELAKNISRPPRFGKKSKVNLAMDETTEWNETEYGFVWKQKITSPNAISLNLMFKELYLPKGAEMFIYSYEKDIIYGPITSDQNSKSGRFNTDLIMSGSIVLEIYAPHRVYRNVKLDLSTIVQGYRNLNKLYGDAASCTIDINCSQGNNWQDESDAVGLILVNGNRHCSGALVNNGCQDYTPMFLTAFHCGNEKDEYEDENDPDRETLEQDEIDIIEDWVIRFQYKSPTCGGSDLANIVSYNGTTLRSYWYDTDFLLVELDEMPSGEEEIKLAGWDRTTTAASSSVSISHPAGDVMKIAIEDHSATDSDVPGSFTNTDFWLVDFEEGEVQGGSSGSPLFNQDGRIVGSMWGQSFFACATNEREAWYGQLHVSWKGGNTSDSGLRDWLTNDTSITQTNTVGIPWIPRSTILVCSSSNVTYTLQNAPAAVTHNVSWSVSSNLILVSSTHSTVTVRQNGSQNGLGTITAVISNDDATTCPTSFTVSQDVQVGPFDGSSYQVLVSGQPGVCPNEYYTYTANVDFGHQSSYTYFWQIPSGWSIHSQSGNNITLYTPSSPGGGTVRVDVNNSCGASGLNGITVYPQCGGGYFAGENPNKPSKEFALKSKQQIEEFKIFPNPVSDQLNVILPSNLINNIQDILISDLFGRLIRRVPLSSESEITFTTEDLEAGTYFITISGNNEVLTKSFIRI